MGSPDVENIKKNYENLLVKLMAGVQKELAVNKQAWLSSELKLILRSLELKLERKILHDVDADLAQALGAVPEPPERRGLFEGRQPATLREVIKNCLALVKCLQYAGDVELISNRFHLKILEAIRDNFDNKEEVMHAYSKSLVRIIQNERTSATKRLEMAA